MKKIIKILAIEIFIVALIFSYFLFKNNSLNYKVAPNSLGEINNNEIINIEDKNKLYIYLEEALLNGETEVNLINRYLFKNPNEIFKILEEISYNNPKVMYYKGAKYTYGKLELFYLNPKEYIIKHQKAVEKIKEEFLENHINNNMSDYEKVLKIHDFIINNGEYDKRVLDKDKVPPESYSSYGILSLGVGVCESYAKSMKYLLDGSGINSLIVIGKSMGENHAWNLVELDGEYYHIDSTWNDPISDNGEDVLRYNFFNINDEELSITHEWNREKYPEAKGKKYNYFIYNDLIVIGKNQLEKQIKDVLLIGKTMYTAKILNFNNEDIEINEIIEELGHKYYKEIRLSGYYYSIDREKGIISIKFFYN
ncbi:MAG TPA: transglutaminase domain-containing protein [Tissierellaceae bacterium]|nr:transglutaminase domain-containing protein [Tissierellaceae bacterium]